MCELRPLATAQGTPVPGCLKKMAQDLDSVVLNRTRIHCGILWQRMWRQILLHPNSEVLLLINHKGHSFLLCWHPRWKRSSLSSITIKATIQVLLLWSLWGPARGQWEKGFTFSIIHQKVEKVNPIKHSKKCQKSPHPIPFHLDRELRVLRVSTVSTGGASLLRASLLLGRERSSRLLARLASQGNPVTKEMSAAPLGPRGMEVDGDRWSH